MRLLVCGDRNWIDKKCLYKHLDIYTRPTIDGGKVVIIHGACTGADSMAGEYAKEHKIDVDPYPAKWHMYGKAAGPIRNKQMLVEGKPDYILAFHNNYIRSVGTKNMIEQAIKAGVHGTLYSSTRIVRIW